MHVYFSGIGGVAIGPLALLAMDAGHTVSGSDLQPSDMSKLVADRGAEVHIGQDGTKIAQIHAAKPIDWFVYTSALPENHPELVFANDNNIKLSKRDEFINQIIKDHNLKLIAVSGTHGKTTTTGMLIWLFKQLGLPVSYSIGTEISFGPPAAYQKDSRYFVYECDEFDRNFLNFEPYVALIPSCDYDHPDTYPSPLEYRQAFRDFIEQSAWVYTWQSVRKYLGLEDMPNVDALNDHDDQISRSRLPGVAARNARLSAEAISNLLDQNLSKCIGILDNFPGTKRRFEKLGDNLYSDYAHHPVEIAATIKMATKLNPNIIALYQPHQNIRQHELLNEGGYKNCFAGVKKVYWLPTYLSREYQDLMVLPPEQLIATLDKPELAAAAKMDDELWQNIQNHRQNGDLVLAMSAGDLDPWLRNKVQHA